MSMTPDEILQAFRRAGEYVRCSQKSLAGVMGDKNPVIPDVVRTDAAILSLEALLGQEALLRKALETFEKIASRECGCKR